MCFRNVTKNTNYKLRCKYYIFSCCLFPLIITELGVRNVLSIPVILPHNTQKGYINAFCSSTINTRNDNNCNINEDDTVSKLKSSLSTHTHTHQTILSSVMSFTGPPSQSIIFIWQLMYIDTLTTLFSINTGPAVVHWTLHSPGDQQHTIPCFLFLPRKTSEKKKGEKYLHNLQSI